MWKVVNDAFLLSKLLDSLTSTIPDFWLGQKITYSYQTCQLLLIGYEIYCISVILVETSHFSMIGSDDSETVTQFDEIERYLSDKFNELFFRCTSTCSSMRDHASPLLSYVHVHYVRR